MKSLVLLLCFVTVAVHARPASVRNFLLALRTTTAQGNDEPVEEVMEALADKLKVDYPADGLQVNFHAYISSFQLFCNLLSFGF